MEDEKIIEMQKIFGSRKWIALQYVGVFLFFFAAALVFGRFSLSSPYIGDDLHLIRVYSTDELKGVWVGTWDPDGIETPGFRPFTIYFYHLLAVAFGSSAIGQRVFLLGIFAMLLTLVGIVARSLFGASYQMILLGGLVGFLHIANVPHYSWITDGVYLVAGLFVFGAIGFALMSVYGGGAAGLVVIGFWPVCHRGAPGARGCTGGLSVACALCGYRILCASYLIETDVAWPLVVRPILDRSSAGMVVLAEMGGSGSSFARTELAGMVVVS